MPEYRLYLFNQAGRVREALTLEHEDDDLAVQESLRRRNGLAVELWRDATIIQRFEASPARIEVPDFDDGFEACGSEDQIAAAALEQALHVAETQLGNVQIIPRGEQDTLAIVSQRGFSAEFLDVFRTVSVSDPSACGRALLHRRTIVIEDVLADDAYRPFQGVALDAGYRSVQSTPLISSGDEVLGVLSTHGAAPGRPSARQLAILGSIAVAAADAMVRLRSDRGPAAA